MSDDSYGYDYPDSEEDDGYQNSDDNGYNEEIK